MKSEPSKPFCAKIGTDSPHVLRIGTESPHALRMCGESVPIFAENGLLGMQGGNHPPPKGPNSNYICTYVFGKRKEQNFGDIKKKIPHLFLKENAFCQCKESANFKKNEQFL